MADVMMNLGGVGFSIDTIQYDQLTRTRSWRWAKVERAARPSHQAIGPDTTMIELRGVAFPHWRGGPDPVARFEDLADRMEPLFMADGRGRPWGRFVIKTIVETNKVFTSLGTARKIEFSMTLHEYGDDDV